MRLGQTSAIQFASKVITSLGGFLATLYFARVVGAEVLGIYFLFLSSSGWINILVEAGISRAITKRMSEGNNPGQYLQIGFLLVGVGVVIISLLLFAFSGFVTDYLGHELSTYFLIGLVGSGAAISVTRSGLAGSHNVHVNGILNSFHIILRIVVQVGAVSLGLGVFGLVFGWVSATLIVSVLGVVYLVVQLDGLPTRELSDVDQKVSSLYSFAKYSWLGSIKAKTNNHADILILGLFVPNHLIGVYSVSWKIASFLTILGSAIEETLFPEFSELESQNNHEEIAQLLGKSIQYTGMFVVPGLFGGALLGERILKLYGSDFTVGIRVLIPLIIAVLIYDYQKQLTSVLQGLDRPDLDFKVNGVFIGSNIALNFVLIQLLGWVGAAVATALSSFLSMVYAYYVVSDLLPVDVPYSEIAKQVGASVVMSAVVLGLKTAENSYGILNNNVLTVVCLVAVGVVTYTGILIGVSNDTRETILRNLGV